jgi:tripartite ATP-independent transporter DctP family solute receptor
VRVDVFSWRIGGSIKPLYFLSYGRFSLPNAFKKKEGCNMKRHFLTLLAVVLVITWFLSSAHGAPIVVRIGHDGATAQPYHPALELTAKIIAERTKNEVNLQIFPSGQLGSQQEQMLGTIQGTQEMWMSNPAWLAQYSPKVGILSAAYLFRDLDHMYKVLRGPIGEELFKELPPKIGVRVLDVWYLGTRQTTLRDKSAATPEEFRGIKLRAPGAPTYIEAVRVLGANPTPMGFGEVYMALKTGVIDGQENPLTTIKSSKFNEVCKYLVLTSHMVDSIIPQINERSWKGLKPEYQKIVIEAFREGGKLNDKLILDGEASLVEEFQKGGMTVIRPNLELFRTRARQVPERFKNLWEEGMIEKIQAVK